VEDLMELLTIGLWETMNLKQNAQLTKAVFGIWLGIQWVMFYVQQVMTILPNFGAEIDREIH